MKNKLLILDDDLVFAQTLQRQFERVGYCAEIVHNCQAALIAANKLKPNLLLLDLNLGTESSLSLVEQLRTQLPDSIIFMLTGYGSIATCVNAIKSGADDYLTKPMSFSKLLEKIEAELKMKTGFQQNEVLADLNEDKLLAPMSASQLEWEHIQAVLTANAGNISETARQLNMHRRTLQRKLNKKAVFRQSDNIKKG
ncbi:response regulator [Catenovulum sp. 2E275]|uniref:response regulator transcription factor n=1 Tax=Catenovulum sp. 2E275 TaxID=2980497 RepID=UPI0021D3AA7E|nr:response regulator [Catenovulum sp. 2E275]MCU4677583.1 response regulator [Catenovulum sp. 2E275]